MLRLLGAAGLEVLRAPPVAKMTRVYAELGHGFCDWQPLAVARAAGQVVICPPGAKLNELRGRIPKTRTAVLTGWAMDSSCRYQYRADAAFPLSDHAGFYDLIEFVKRVAPKRVFTRPGFATEFAAPLRDLGIKAWALGEANQLTLGLR